jgi:hypothetical protein
MDLGLKTDVLQDITVLMNPLDEEEWKREGLFKKADTGGVHSTTHS